MTDESTKMMIRQQVIGMLFTGNRLWLQDREGKKASTVEDGIKIRLAMDGMLSLIGHAPVSDEEGECLEQAQTLLRMAVEEMDKRAGIKRHD